MSSRKQRKIPMGTGRSNPTPNHKHNKVLAYAIGETRVTTKEVSPIDVKGDLVPWFTNRNNFPQQLLDTYNRSPLHKACINTKYNYAIGQDLYIYRRDGKDYEADENFEDYISECNGDMESLFEVTGRLMLDNILFKGFVTLIKITNVGGKKFFGLFHLDASKCRKNKDESEVYFSHEWEKVKDLKKGIEADYVSVYKTWEWQEEAGEYAWFFKEYEPGKNYYPVPDYYTEGQQLWADINYKIPAFNKDRIANKFMPSAVISSYGEPPEDMTATDYVRHIRDTFTGEGNNSKIFAELLDVDAPETKITFAPDAPDGIFMDLQELSVKNLLTAHSIPEALMLVTAGKLSNTSEIKILQRMFQNTTIENYRTPVLRVINKLLKHFGFVEYKVGIIDVELVTLEDMITDIAAYMQFNEVRESIGLRPIDNVKESEDGGSEAN